MATELKDIKEPIRGELKQFEKKFRASMKSSVPLLDRITYYIVKRKGKQVRPMFVFLAARALGEINEKTYQAASLVELLHTATLVHDDVVDDSMKRRGFFSINALWKNKIAVLVGDYLLSRGLLLTMEHKNFDLLEITSRAVKAMSEGELLQIEKARRLDVDEEVYYDIIRQKTASLIAAACSAGAASIDGDEQVAEEWWNFGIKIGMAFQIKDDLFDYGNAETGKPSGIDIKEQKMTLPLIYALQQAHRADRNHIIRLVKNHHDDREKVAEVIDFVHTSNGISYAQERMRDYRDRALEWLNGVPDSPARRALEDLVHFVIKREK